MSEETAPRHGSRGWLALMGFSLATAAPGEARASGTSPGSSSTSSGSLTASTGSSATVTTLLYTGLTLTTVVGVTVLIVIVTKMLIDASNDNNSSNQAGAKTKALMDAGLLAARGDLGLELGLIVESPAAFDQLDDEFERGDGPAVQALVRATGIPADTLRAHWDAATEARGPVESEADATRLVVDLLVRMAPDLAGSEAQTAAWLWQLARESAGATDPASPHARAWAARWLGVPEESVEAAADVAFAELQGLSEREQRVAIMTDPERFMWIMGAELQRDHAEVVDKRIAELFEHLRPWLPESMADQSALLLATG